jgi:phage terminase Nu1 subunit (DNA packaging protein)
MERHTILNSWKEIAVYMGRAVRTVQRWERECDFPVHRPRGKKRSAVFALSKEIDTWLENCPQSTEDINHELPNDTLNVQRKIFDESLPNGEARKVLPLQQAMIAQR